MEPIEHIIERARAEQQMEPTERMERVDEPMEADGMEISVVANGLKAGRHDLGGSVGGKLSSTDDGSCPPVQNDQQTSGRGSEPKPSSVENSENEFEEDFRDLIKSWTRDVKAMAKERNEDILNLVKSLGGDAVKYRRERARGMKNIVSELYSPPRVTAAAKLLPELKCIPGFALDLTTVDEQGRPWDFNDEQTRERARALYREQRPMLVVGSPMCTAWSAWQRINFMNKDPEQVERLLEKARVHLRFCMEIYKEQHEAGRYFLHEHPAQAASWDEPMVQEMMNMAGVVRTTMDQCRYGMAD